MVWVWLWLLVCWYSRFLVGNGLWVGVECGWVWVCGCLSGFLGLAVGFGGLWGCYNIDFGGLGLIVL